MVVTEQTSEVEALRSAHRRRLVRLKSISTSYRLVKKQLQLYEDDYLWSAVFTNSPHSLLSSVWTRRLRGPKNHCTACHLFGPARLV